MHYDLVDLQLFLAVADEENITRGAARCHLSPSSASLRLKALEEAVGSLLMIRKARGVALTAAGHVMKEHVRRCIAQLGQMHVDLQRFSTGLLGHLTFLANNNAISAHLPQDLARFFSLHPNVRITLKERTSHEIVSAVASGQADLGVVAVDMHHPELAYRSYKRDVLVLLAPMGGGFAGRTSVRFVDCLREPFISLQSGAALHTFLMNHAAALGGRLDVRVQVSGYRAIARLVASGAGIGVVPRSALEPQDRERLAVVEIEEPWSQRDLQVCFRPGADDNPQHYVAKLIQVLCGDEPAAAPARGAG